MAADRSVQRVTAAVERRPPVATTTQRNAVAVAPSPARTLQQHLGNRGAQLFAAQVVARSSAPGSPLGGGTSASPFFLSHPDDAHEREAHRVADVVMQTTVRGSTSTSPSMPTVQRVCADCEKGISTRERADQPVVAADATHVHRSASTSGASQVSAPVAASIHDMQGGGAPLSAATRALFEPRFGADFSHVRVHTGGRADSTAKAISAKAFTVGSDIVFASGQYSPESHEGQHLLAHELTHVVQQDAGTRRVNRQAHSFNPGIVTRTNAPTIQRFDLPFGYETDFSWKGVKTAATVVRDVAWEALQAIADEIAGLVESALARLGDGWEFLKGLMRSAFNAAKDVFGNLVFRFLLSPLGFLADVLTQLDPAALKKSWEAFSSAVTSMAGWFKTIAASLLKPFEALWGGINGFATWVLDKLSSLLGSFLFKRLPNDMQRLARDAVNRLKSAWKKISDEWTAFYNEIKSWIDGAIDAVAGFVRKVSSFVINGVIAAIVKVAQVLGFLKDFIADPGKYIAILAKRCVQAFDGVESRFAGVVSQYFGSAKAAVPATAGAAAAPIKVHRAPVSGAGAEPRTSASLGEIGDGIVEMMGEKWKAFKANPMTVVTGLLKDLFIPFIGNVQDIIQLFHDIKNIIAGLLHPDSLQDLWTSLLQILDIPIKIYNTAVSILMRTLMLPLLIASFIPVVREIAVAIGFELLMAFLAGVGANLAQKMLLLTTGKTVKKQKEDAYNSVADNLIALVITGAIMLLALLLPAIYGLMKGVYNFIKGKVFGIKVPPLEGKGAAPAEGKSGSVETKGVEIEGPTRDGKGTIKIMEDGRVIVCRSCEELRIKYSDELNAKTEDGKALTAEAQELNKKVNAADAIKDANKKKTAMEAVEDELAQKRQAHRAAETVEVKMQELKKLRETTSEAVDRIDPAPEKGKMSAITEGEAKLLEGRRNLKKAQTEAADAKAQGKADAKDLETKATEMEKKLNELDKAVGKAKGDNRDIKTEWKAAEEEAKLIEGDPKLQDPVFIDEARNRLDNLRTRAKLAEKKIQDALAEPPAAKEIDIHGQKLKSSYGPEAEKFLADHPNYVDKFNKAMDKGAVGPKGETGIVPSQEPGYKYKLKILGEGGNYRIHGRVEGERIIWDKVTDHD